MRPYFPEWNLCTRGALVLCLLAALAHVAAAQTSPDNFDDLARRAEAALDSRPAEAAELYKQALAIRPEWAEGWFSLGGALYQLDRYAEATDAFRKGIALAPEQGTAWAFLGLCEAGLDNEDQALTDIRKGEGLGLGSNIQFETAVRVKAAQILIKFSAFNEALEQLQPLAYRSENYSTVVPQTMGLATLGVPRAFSELSPERRAVVALAGKAAWALGSQQPAEATAAYAQLIAQYPNEPGVHYAYGLYLMETDLTAALAEFRKEAEIDPKHWPALMAIGSLELRRGAPDVAITFLRQAMKLVPPRQRWMCHADLGRALMASDSLEAAIAQFETAVRLMPTNPQVHSYLSQAYRRAGRSEDAKKEAAEFQKYKSQQDPLGVPALRPSPGRN